MVGSWLNSICYSVDDTFDQEDNMSLIVDYVHLDAHIDHSDLLVESWNFEYKCHVWERIFVRASENLGLGLWKINLE